MPETNYCKQSRTIWMGGHSYPADGDSGFQAVPVAEVWNSTGTQGFNPKHFTMACTGGAIAKCYRWGYRAWKPMTKALGHVQACTRMAMADYCGNGKSHTMEGTPISIYDFAQPQANEAPAEPMDAIPTWYPSGWPGLEMQFETAWTGEPEDSAKRDPKQWRCTKWHESTRGPRDLDRRSRRPSADEARRARECLPRLWEWKTPASVGGALCLSKKRWDAIGLADGTSLSCPTLKDPRLQAVDWPPKPTNSRCPSRPPHGYRPGEFCDYFADGKVDHQRLIDARGLLFNGSPYLDSLLSIWKKSPGADRWTTVGKIDNGPYGPAAPDGYAKHSTPLGSVLKESTPESVLEWLPSPRRLVPLYSYSSTTGRHVTTTRRRPPAGYTQPVSQGLIYPCEQTQIGPQWA